MGQPITLDRNAGSSMVLLFAVWDTAHENKLAGDAANITVDISKDGAAAALAAGAITAVTGITGLYQVTLTNTELNGEYNYIEIATSTASYLCDDVIVHTTTPGANIIEGTITDTQAQRLMLAVLTGKATGGGSTSIIFRDTADMKDRVTATVDTNGSRTAVTRTVT